MTLEKERAVTRRVTRRGDHARAPWDVQYFVARERLGILNLARLGRAARVIPTKKRQMPGRQISPSSLTGLASPDFGPGFRSLVSSSAWIRTRAPAACSTVASPV